MIKLNKNMHKRASTYANYIAIAVGGAMVYVPDMVPTQYTPHVMCLCAVTVALCQRVSKDAK